MTIREFLRQFDIDVDNDDDSPADTLNGVLIENRIREQKSAWNKLSQEEQNRRNKEYCKVYRS